MLTPERGRLHKSIEISEPNQEQLHAAFNSHQQGDLVGAKKIYEAILIDHPAHFDGLHLSGLLAYHTREFKKAEHFFDQAIQINRSFAPLYLNRANTFHQQQRFEEALVNYAFALAIKPDYADACNNMGNTLKIMKRYDEALTSYNRTLLLNPAHVQAYNNYGATLAELERFSEAIKIYDQAIAIKSDYADSYNNRAVTLHRMHRNEDALASYEAALFIAPDSANFYNNRAIAFHTDNEFEKAICNYRLAIIIKPDYADSFYNCGDTLKALGRFDDAIASYNQAIVIMPNYVQAYNNRGLALQQLNRLEEAILSFDNAILLDSDLPEAVLNQGVIFQKLQRFEKAVVSYGKAFEIRPSYAEAYYNRANILKKLKHFDEALLNYKRATCINPNYTEAYYNRGLTLLEMKLFKDALDSIEDVLVTAPDYLDAYNSRATILAELQRVDEALSSFDRAFRIKSDYAEAYANRGVMYHDVGRFDEAIKDYDRALSLNPDLEFTEGNVFSTRMKICDWSRYDRERKVIPGRLEMRERAFHPFYVLGAVDDCRLQKVAAEVWCDAKYLTSIRAMSLPKYRKNRKIRIGYFSPDFGNHPVSYLTARMFELHDRSNFEVIGFYFGDDVHNEMHLRLRKSFDWFHDVRALSGYKIAELARTYEIDIAIDLCGYTLDSRPDIFAHRAAPIQISYLGFPGTMGASFIDYLIADQILIPPDQAPSYSEQIIYLPCFQVNDDKRALSRRFMTRAEFGFSEHSFVFCCFNNTYKFNPEMFDLWGKILRSVDCGVLWIFAETSAARLNIIREFHSRGIPQERLVFAEKVGREEYLARYRLADLFLDTLPYNGGTTVSDALWAGLPVLAQAGQSFAGRMAASLVSALDLAELVTRTPDEYVALAIELASNRHKLAAIRLKLASNIPTSLLFDSLKSTRCIEAGYKAAHERHHADLQPDHIYVDV